MQTSPIACELHDYIEIVCLYAYRVQLKLRDGQVIEGDAQDTFTSEDKREYLIVNNNGQSQQVELSQLSKLQVLTANAKFRQVTF